MQYVNFVAPNSLTQTGGSSSNISSSIHPGSLDSVPLQSPNKNGSKKKRCNCNQKSLFFKCLFKDSSLMLIFIYFFFMLAPQHTGNINVNTSVPFVPTFTPSNSSNQYLTGPMIPLSNNPTQIFNPVSPPPAQNGYSPSTIPPPGQIPMFTPSNSNAAPNAPSNFYTPTQPATSVPQAPQSVYQPAYQQQGYPPASNSPPEYNISPFASMNSHNNISHAVPTTPKVTPYWFYLRTWTIQLPFYKVMTEWVPFSKTDSHNLEHEFLLHRTNGSSSTVQTDGGRYDVNLDNMNRQSIYWKEESSKVRRCTWFYKEENQFVPYEVEISEKLEVIFC